MTLKPLSFILRIRFWPYIRVREIGGGRGQRDKRTMTAKPIRPISPLDEMMLVWW
jgi:hypothetical protein